jgi:hypothetical protein
VNPVLMRPTTNNNGATTMQSKKLKNLIELSSSVKIYVPSTADVNQVCDNTDIVDMVLSEMSAMFGGATKFDALGCWSSPACGLVKERIMICCSYCTEAQLSANIDSVVEICERVKSEMGQEAVSLEINNKLYFI